MNKTTFTVLRVLNWLYVAGLIAYGVFLVYTLEFKPVVPPVSSVPSLSVSEVTKVADTLKIRLSIEGYPQYSSPSGILFGKTEPFIR